MQKKAGLIALSIPVLLICLGAALLFGSEFIPLSTIFSAQRDVFADVLLFQIRLPRALLAALIGALLAGSGALFQGLFRNGLAESGIMGVSPGATLGAVLASFTAAYEARALFAFFGALIAVLIVYSVAGKAKSLSGGIGLLLAGTAMSSFFSALTSLLILVNTQELHRIYLWTLGSFNGKGWQEALFVLPLAMVSFLLFFVCSRPLDVLSGGELSASSLGLSVSKWRMIIVATASLATAAAVCTVGTIGFIGLIAPHIARILIGPSHARLLGFSMILGSILLLLADIISRTVLSPAEIPVGIITALMGSPFFLFILFKKRVSV